jgi:lipopolysaccharide heptosyltransferase I
MKILIVRLGALGDIVHAIPAAAALRAALPDAQIDWMVEAKHRPILDLVTVIDRVVPLEAPTFAGWADAVRRARQVPYDIAFDLQGLMKSAVLARASGATRVAGFSIWHLREKAARPFYSETDAGSSEGTEAAHDDEPEPHVIHKNLRLLRVAGVHTTQVEFPLASVPSRALAAVRTAIGDAPFALINPGAAWPNKRWPPERFGELATFLRDVRGLQSIVLWGPGEEALAQSVVDASSRAATVSPPTEIADLVALSRAADLMVSGDTGPVHIAAAVGTPIVAIYGPTDPARNGPWMIDDLVVSRFEECDCHYQRQCRRIQAGPRDGSHADRWCLESISVAEVTAAIQQRLATPGVTPKAAGDTRDRAAPDV